MYTVFLDTNIFIKLGMRFDSGILLELRRYAESNIINLLISDIIIAELKKHKRDNILKAVERYLSAQNTIKNTYSIKFNDEVLNDSLGERIIKQEYLKIDNFFRDCNANKLSFNNIEFTQILDDYIEKIPPFTENKSHEFKDAINVYSIKSFGNENDSIHIVSNDIGFNKSFDQESRFVIHNDLFEFIKIVRMNTNCFAFSLIPLEQYLKEAEVREYIKNGLAYDLTYELYLDDVYTDIDIVDVGDIEINSIEYSINDIGDEPFSGELYINYNLNIDFEFLDPYQSVYDSEDRVFVYEHFIKGKECFVTQVTVPFTFTFDYEKLINREIEITDIVLLNDIQNSIDIDVHFDECKVELSEKNFNFET